MTSQTFPLWSVILWDKCGMCRRRQNRADGSRGQQYWICILKKAVQISGKQVSKASKVEYCMLNYLCFPRQVYDDLDKIIVDTVFSQYPRLLKKYHELDWSRSTFEYFRFDFTITDDVREWSSSSRYIWVTVDRVILKIGFLFCS